MAAGTFDPKLTDGDFRARRFYLPADAFALVEGLYETASDPMLEDPWHELINLPTDVLLRTSDHHGRQIAQLVALVVQVDRVAAAGGGDRPVHLQCELGRR